MKRTLLNLRVTVVLLALTGLSLGVTLRSASQTYAERAGTIAEHIPRENPLVGCCPTESGKQICPDAASLAKGELLPRWAVSHTFARSLDGVPWQFDRRVDLSVVEYDQNAADVSKSLTNASPAAAATAVRCLIADGAPSILNAAVPNGPPFFDVVTIREAEWALELRVASWASIAAGTLVGLFGFAWGIRTFLRMNRGRCVACGYDLMGLPEAGVCPECGRGSRIARVSSGCSK